MRYVFGLDPGHLPVFKAKDVGNIYDEKAARFDDRKVKTDHSFQ